MQPSAQLTGVAEGSRHQMNGELRKIALAASPHQAFAQSPNYAGRVRRRM